MEYERAYDLEIEVGNEVVFQRSEDRHRKVRVLITEAQREGDTVSFTGHSLGSSAKGIKSAKRDEAPVVVKGSMRRHGEDDWQGSLEPVG